MVRIIGYLAVPAVALALATTALVSLRDGQAADGGSAALTEGPRRIEPVQPSVVRQIGPNDCGLAAVATLARLRGLAAPAYQELLARYGSGRHSLDDLKRIAAALGIPLRAIRVTSSGLGTIATPAILHLRSEHFVVLLARSDSAWEIADPAAGLQRVRPAVVKSQVSGFALVHVPAEAFASDRR